jgi:GR25 family glycosyltransferase involved in LPS biosynthesis
VDIFLINLDRQPERLLSAQTQLKKLGLESKRISAVDMNSLTVQDSDLVTLGVKACWESHRLAFISLLNSDQSHALILEDDFKVFDNQIFLNLLNQFPLSEWDLVQIGFLTQGPVNKFSRIYKNFETDLIRVLIKVSHHSEILRKRYSGRLRIERTRDLPKGFVPDDFMPGTHAYLISRDLASVALKLNNPQFLSADDFFTALAKMRAFRSARLKKSNIGQNQLPGLGPERFISSR